MKKFLTILLYVLLVVSAVLTVYFFLNAPQDTKTITDSQDMALNVFLNWAYILFGVAALSAIVLPVINMIDNPQSLKRNAVKLAIVVAVCALAYVLAPGDPVVVSASVTTSPSDFKMTDTLLYITYFLVGAAIISIVVGMIVNAIRNR